MGKINGITAFATTVGECRQYVDRKVAFHTTNKQLFGYWMESGVYAVFSYGQHWPLFVYEPKTDRWFGNEDKYGVTTSKHYGKAHPWGVSVAKLHCGAMKTLVQKGYDQLVLWRLTDNDMEQHDELMAGLRNVA